MQGALYNVLFNWMILLNSSAECDGTQKIFRYQYFFRTNFSGTGTGTFFWDQIFPLPVLVLFSGPNFSGTGTSSFFRDQFFPVLPKMRNIPGNSPVPVPNSREFSGTGIKFYRYRYRYFFRDRFRFFFKTKFFRYLDHPKRKNFSSEWPPTPKI